VRSLSWCSSNSLRHFLKCSTPITPSPYTSIKWRCMSMGECVSSIETESHFELRGTKFAMLVLLYSHLIPWTASEFCTICCMLPLP
jgi:hypothetical protein